MMKKIRVGVLFGGRSGEHEVSLLSAASVMKAIDTSKYEVVPIGITKQGQWVIDAHADQLLKGEYKESQHLRAGDPEATTSAAVLAHGESVLVPPVPSGAAKNPSLVPFQQERRKAAAALEVDVIFPVLHGTFGEDGTIQGLLELADIAYVGSGVLGSSAAMDEAAKYDRKIVIEQGVGGKKNKAREIECAVLGNDDPKASICGEIVPAKEFYDYEAKYIDEGSSLLIPAKITKTHQKQAQEMAIRAFQACDCAGLSRVDFLMDPKSGKLFINEVNTMPGFTSIS